MVQKILAKYLLEELDEIDNAFAAADKNQKIFWYNKNFKKLLGSARIKGKSILSLFPDLDKHFLNKAGSGYAAALELPGHRLLKINLLGSKKSIDGYFLRLEESKLKQNGELTEVNKDHPLFQEEFLKILTLLIKESSLSDITDEILKKCVSLTGAEFGIAVLHDEINNFTFRYVDPSKHIENKKELEEDMSGNYSYVIKWLSLNRSSLVASRANVGYHFTEVLKCKSLIISPGFFENELLTTFLLGKKNKDFNTNDININEQFSSFLAFTIRSIRIRELNQALENRLLQAQKLETIGKLSSGMAHDFNNLLSSIFGSLNLLKKRVPQNENVMRLLDNIEKCSIRAKDLTKGLLSYGKPTPQRKELVKPNILLAEIAKVITQTFPREIIFEQNIADNLYDVLGNSTEVYQVLLNLCVNAKESFVDNGKITLDAYNVTVNEKNLINYPLLEKGNYVCFSVKDNGTGINEENIRKIFEPYFSTKEKETGSGLGLYVSYGIIKAHNGHIDVSSKTGEGTQFDVYLPSYEPTKIQKTNPADKIILLADDEVMLRDLLAELLESSGYTVIKVLSGIEALKLLTEEIKVDLAIIDYNMPGMNGIECIREIKRLNFNIPVILSSGSFSLENNVDVKEVGVNGIVSKPYEFDTMLATIRDLI